MKVKLRFCLIGLFILLFSSSCGQAVKQTISPVSPAPVSGEFKKAVILPFADYAPTFSSYGYWRRNILVIEALKDEFYRAGFISPAEEDVVRYLVDRGIIRSPYEVSSETAVLQQQLEEGWSESMKKQIEDIIHQNMAGSETRAIGLAKHRSISLNSNTLKELAGRFGADYVVRGRIIEFRSGTEDSFNPIKTGILPFVFKSGQRTIFGIAESDTYECIDKAAIGGALGAAIGLAASTTNQTLNATIWGVVGAGAAFLSDKGGKVPKATVQLRMLVQDAGTGEIIWLNRAEVNTVPISAYAEHDREILFSTAIRHAARSLVDNFVATLASGKVVKVDKQGVTISPKITTGHVAEAADAQKAAEDSGESARDSRRAADQAGGSAQKADEAAYRAEKASREAADAAKTAKEAAARTEEMFEKINAK